tara:strand:+ start:34 stop:828 length:795 start_codon:yes stop_codon:yes gene_type:complete
MFKCIDVDLVQRIKVTGLFFLQFYKVVTGTLLTLFIPQNCDGNICSLTENYENEEPYHKWTLYWNILSMMCFLTTYAFELKRENWAIKYLDIDNNLPDNHLKSVIVKEKELDRQMDRLNLIYYRIILITAFSYFVNILLTIRLLKKNYHSVSTLSCFASFSLLVMMKLYNSITVGYYSVKHDKMMSAYMSEFVSFNVLDEDYVKSKELLLDKPKCRGHPHLKKPEKKEEDDDDDDEFKDVSEEVDIEDILPTVENGEKVTEKAP